MRQTHVAGERLFLDYAGDRLTGEIRMAQIFVAVLGASSFTYARATWTQTLADWIDAHTHAFAAIGGVPQGRRRTHPGGARASRHRCRHGSLR
jgi:transposase